MSVQLAIAQTARYEYWLDNDYDARVISTNVPTDVTLDLDVSSKKPGLHYFSFRAQSSTGQWGGMSRYLFFIRESVYNNAAFMTKYEYWLDNDFEQRTVVNGEVSEVPLSLDVSNLKPGLHYFNFRAQGRSGQWGGMSRYLFFIRESVYNNAAFMTKYEYWLDNDYEHRTVVDGVASDIAINIDVSSLSSGLHYFNVRAQGRTGQWGGLSRYLFFIKDNDVSQLSAIRYWIDDDTQRSVEQVTDDTVTLTADISRLSEGTHTFYVEGVAADGTSCMLNGYEFSVSESPAVVEPYAVLSDDNTVLTFYYDDQKEARSGMSVGPFTDYGQNGWRSLNVTKVVFDQTFANCHPTSTAFWLDGLYNLNEIEGIENLNTDNVTDMRSMFEACSSLTSIDFSHFNTENVTSFDHMFWNCTSLTNLDLSSFNTQKVTSTYWMFALCNRLTSVNLNGFNTSSMETMEGMFYDCASLAAIQAGSAAIPDSIYAQVNNPNLLVYVNNASLAPSNVQNIVVNGQAREIVLTDVTSGNNNFYVPQAFTAERISYTRNFTQSTQVGVSRGWESIALPFDVQTITHETKGTIAPFGNTASNRHFWLRELGSNGLQSATGIAANTPYVISMPNSSDYTDNNNLAGRVTFAAENATIPVTEVKASAMADQSIVMIPTMQRQDRSSAVWALNVGEVRGRYLEGSVFERDYREVRPFEAYTVHRQENTQPAPRYVPLQEIGGTTGINVMEDVRSKKDDVWYTTDGRKLQGKPSEKGVYINNGQKIVIR